TTPLAPLGRGAGVRGAHSWTAKGGPLTPNPSPRGARGVRSARSKKPFPTVGPARPSPSPALGSRAARTGVRAGARRSAGTGAEGARMAEPRVSQGEGGTGHIVITRAGGGAGEGGQP